MQFQRCFMVGKKTTEPHLASVLPRVAGTIAYREGDMEGYQAALDTLKTLCEKQPQRNHFTALEWLEWVARPSYHDA